MRRKTFKILSGLAFAAAMSLSWAAASFADEQSQFVTGTTINGIGVSGLTVDQARERVEGFYAGEYKLTVTEKGGVQEEIRGAEIGYRVTVPDGMQAILDGQNASGRAYGPSVDNSHRMQMTAVYDEAALADKIGKLRCISSSNITITSDARISDYQEGQPFTIIEEVQGNDVDAERVAEAVKSAVSAGESEVNLEESGCYRTVRITSENEQLRSLCDAMNKCREMTITYTFGENAKPLTGETICTWITGSDGGQVGVDAEKAAAFVKSLADKYDTANTERSFHTASGKDVVLNGPYGWKIDQEAETAALIAMIRTGQTQTREPQYSSAAVSRTGADWGDTYVETDLTGQHVYMYQNGNLVWDAPCVTGNVEKGHTTPDGIYSLNYKQTDRILRGAKQADGTYEYESHVDYWMPFNGGIGFHDASWREKFGGTIYQYGGSHGCVNLPPAKAKELYDLIYSGIPVLCYH